MDVPETPDSDFRRNYRRTLARRMAFIAGCVVLLIAIFCRKKGCSTCGKCNDKSCKYKKNGAR